MSVAYDYFQIPDHCPACSGILSVEGQFLYCRSRACPVQLSGSVRVWVKRLGLLHWGDALIDSLTDPTNPRVNSLADLYKLEPEDIATCTSGIKVAKKCWGVLHSNKNVKLELLIAAMNIPNLAIATATDIVSAGYNTVDKVLALTPEQLQEIPNIGQRTAQQVFYGLQERKRAILDLAEVLDIRGPSSGGPLSGKSFCITEATSKPRKTIQKMILDAGGVVKESVGADLSFLVTNHPETNTKKMQNAKKHGVPIISESRLYELMGADSNL